jgi:hypothetical protein
VPKTERLTIRIDPIVKESLWRVAEHDNRSVANLLEVLILEHCKKIGIKAKENKRPLDGSPGTKRSATQAE